MLHWNSLRTDKMPNWLGMRGVSFSDWHPWVQAAAKLTHLHPCNAPSKFHPMSLPPNHLCCHWNLCWMWAHWVGLTSDLASATTWIVLLSEHRLTTSSSRHVQVSFHWLVVGSQLPHGKDVVACKIFRHVSIQNVFQNRVGAWSIDLRKKVCYNLKFCEGVAGWGSV